MAVTVNNASVTVNAEASAAVPAGANTLGRTDAPKVSASVTFASGTGAGKVSKLAAGERTVTAAPETIDLTSTLLGPDGVAVDFTTTGVKFICIRNKETGTGKKLTLGGAAANPWVGTAAPNDGPLVGATDKVTVHPGDIWLRVSPYEAGGFGVSGTSKNLKVDPGANTVTYQIEVWG